MITEHVLAHGIAINPIAREPSLTDLLNMVNNPSLDIYDRQTALQSVLSPENVVKIHPDSAFHLINSDLAEHAAEILRGHIDYFSGNQKYGKVKNRFSIQRIRGIYSSLLNSLKQNSNE